MDSRHSWTQATNRDGTLPLSPVFLTLVPSEEGVSAVSGVLRGFCL